MCFFSNVFLSIVQVRVRVMFAALSLLGWSLLSFLSLFFIECELFTWMHCCRCTLLVDVVNVRFVRRCVGILHLVMLPSADRYHLLVEGYGLAAVMGAPGIDGTRTRSNHIIEVR